MGDRKKGITVAGSLIADVFYKIDSYPKSGMLTNIREITQNIGGTGNLILDLAKMDSSLQVHVSAIVGKDEGGNLMLKKLSQYDNINIQNITQKGSSSVTHVMNAQDTKQRTFFFHPAASDVYDESYIDWDMIQSDIFHLEYLLLMKKVDESDSIYGTHGAKILHDAQSRGMKTSIDIVSEQGNRASKIVPSALKHTDFCIINEVEAEAVTGIRFTSQGLVDNEKVKIVLKSLAEKGVGEWVVIHCPQAGYGYDCRNKNFVRVESLCLPEGYIKGTNGAGDAYCSGILYGAYQGMNLKKAMRYAAACAACSLSEENGTDGMRNKDEIWKLESQYHAHRKKGRE